MKTIIHQFFLLLLLLSSRVAASTGQVVELNDDNFEHLTQAATGQTTGKWLIKFVAHWCGHCKSLKPIFESLVEEHEDWLIEQGISVASIDLVDNPFIHRRFLEHVKGYPTILFFAHGKMFKFQGQRSLFKLRSFLIQNLERQDGGLTVPPHPSALELAWLKALTWASQNKHVRDYILDFDHIIKKQARAGVLLVGIGYLMGLLLSYGAISLGKQRQQPQTSNTSESSVEKEKEE